MPKSLTIALLVMAALILAACSLDTGNSQSKALAHKELTVDEIRERVKANPNVKLVDVRSEAEYKQGHIEGAIIIPQARVKTKAESLLKQDDEIIFYCHDGPMGTDAANTLAGMGYTNLANMKGGIAEWRRLGLPIVK